MRRVVILGGGVGGAVAAMELSRRLTTDTEVVLLDKEGRHYFPPSYPWLVMGWRRPEQVWRPLSRLKAPHVSIRQEEAISIDPDERRVTTDAGEVSYDHLLISLGAQLDPSAIEGFAGVAHHPYDLEGAMGLAQAVRAFRGGKVAIGVSRLPFKCPAAPYEIAFLLDYYFREKGIRDQVEMEFFTPEPAPLPAAGPAIGDRAMALMEEREIPIRVKREMDHVDPEAGVVHFKAEGQMAYDLLIAVPPHTTCEAVRRSELTKEGPWIPVDRHTMRSSYDDIYAVGDVTSIPTPSGHVPLLPKAGVFAHGQAKVAARNIAADLAGGPEVRWDGYGLCFMEIGYGKGGMVRGNFYGEGPPSIRMRKPSRIWHWGKVLTERRWLRKLFR